MNILYHNKINFSYNNIVIVGAGFQKKDINHYQKSVNKCEYVIQYVTSGKGYFYIDNKTYNINKGDVFILPKNRTLSYKSDTEAPYTYWWLEIDGELVESMLSTIGLSLKNPIINFNDEKIGELFKKIYECLGKNSITSLMRANGYLYEALSLMMSKTASNNMPIKKRESDYVNTALAFIAQNFNQDITIKDIAHHIGINRSYLFSLFKKYLSISPIDYLLKYRIEKSRELLLNPNLSIYNIAINSGFNSISNYSMRFKSFFGMSPTDYRKTKIYALEK